MNAKESSGEIGAIVPGLTGLREGGAGLAAGVLGDATINPEGDQGGPVVVAVAAAAAVLVAYAAV